MLAYSDSIRAELFAHKNIQVLNAQPGYINTNVSINALTSDNRKNNENDDEHRNGWDSFLNYRDIPNLLSVIWKNK